MRWATAHIVTTYAKNNESVSVRCYVSDRIAPLGYKTPSGRYYPDPLQIDTIYIPEPYQNRNVVKSIVIEHDDGQVYPFVAGKDRLEIPVFRSPKLDEYKYYLSRVDPE